MSDHSPQHTTTGPLAVPMNGNIPAGWWTDPEAVDTTVPEQAANAAVEAEDITEEEVINNG